MICLYVVSCINVLFVAKDFSDSILKNSIEFRITVQLIKCIFLDHSKWMLLIIGHSEINQTMNGTCFENKMSSEWCENLIDNLLVCCLYHIISILTIWDKNVSVKIIMSVQVILYF